MDNFKKDPYFVEYREKYFNEKVQGLFAPLSKIEVISKINSNDRTPEQQKEFQMYADLLTFDEKFYTSLGIPIWDNVSYPFDEPRSRVFRKEASILYSVVSDGYFDYERFIVVKNKQTGDPVLLKRVLYGYHIRHPETAKLENRIDDLHDLSWISGSVVSTNVGASIKYPIPENKLVQRDGKLWLASYYYDNASDWYPSDTNWEIPEQIQNINAVLSRPLFNLLIGSVGDGVNQSIFDSEGNYYAIDVGFMGDLQNTDDGGDLIFIQKTPVNVNTAINLLDEGRYGHLKSDDPGFTESVSWFLELLENADKNFPDKAMESFIGPEIYKNMYKAELYRRVTLMKDVCKVILEQRKA